MAATRTPSPPAEWMPNGFPPRSFPPEGPGPQPPPPPDQLVVGPDAPPPAPVVAPVARRRSRLIAPLAAVVALLLLAAGLVLATRGDDDDDEVTAGSSTTGVDTSVADPTTTAITPSSLEPVGATTAPVATTTPSTAAPAVLETAQTTLAIPNVDTTAGPQAARLTLRNRGASPLAYTTQSSSALLTANPARGTVPPGAATDLTVTLDGSRATSEGPFKATLTIGGNGGTKVVQVTSTIGRPPRIFDDVGEPCSAATTTCSRQIKLAPATRNDASPCNTSWAYAVRITDQSQIQARAVARLGLGNADAPLASAALVGGPRDVFVSRPMAPVPPGTDLRFFLEAADQHGFSARLAEQVIAC